MGPTVADSTTDETRQPAQSAPADPDSVNSRLKRICSYLQPYVVVAMFLLAISTAVGAAFTLTSSHNVSVKEWKSRFLAPPTVVLAVCTSIANISVQFLLYHGLVTRWWRKAVDSTSEASTERLRALYDQGTSRFQAALALVQLRTTSAGLASLATLMLVLSNPFLQKSSVTKKAGYYEKRNLTANLMRNPEQNFTTGEVWDDSDLREISTYSEDFTSVVQDFNSGSQIVLRDETGCSDNATCYGYVYGMGFRTNCTKGTYTTASYNSSGGATLEVPQGTIFETNVTAGVLTLDFYVTTKYLNTTIKNATNNETITGLTTTCLLTLTRVMYPVQIVGRNVTLLGNIKNDIENDIPVEPAGESGGWVHDKYQWTRKLGGLEKAFSTWYDSEAVAQHTGGNRWNIEVKGKGSWLASVFTTYPTIYDPIDVILEGMRGLVFRMAIGLADQGATPGIGVEGEEVGFEDAYRTNFKFGFVGVAAILISILGVLPLYWKRWEPQGGGSLNPIDVTKWDRMDHRLVFEER